MKTVLVVDDSDAVLEGAKRALEPAGYKVITRNKALGSVAVILRERPDVVLIDVNMSTLAGDTTAKILSRVTQNSDTIVLLHSTLPIEALRVRAQASGAHGYLQKTESAVDLVRRIEYWLNKSRPVTSSSRLQAASVVSSTPLAPPTRTSSSHIKVAPLSSSATPTPATSAGSSGHFKAAPIVTSHPPSGSTNSATNARDSAGTKSALKGGTERIPGKVLFVDDDWSMLNTYRTIIAGHLEADFVATADDAFHRILSTAPPPVIVCDVMMPGLSGVDIYRRAIQLDVRWARRFLFVTGAASTPLVAEFLNSLDVRAFHKPIAPKRLLEALIQLTQTARR
jgi:CheY-like chemotaxis protein